MAQSVEATNVLEVLETPRGLLALPAGRGIWFGTDLLAQEQDVPDGDVAVRLRRGDAVSETLVIPVTQFEPGPILPTTDVSLSPQVSTYTFPAGVQSFTDQQVAEITLEVTTSGTAGTPVWRLVGAPAGYSLSGSGDTRQVVYSGSRPDSPAGFCCAG